MIRLKHFKKIILIAALSFSYFNLALAEEADPDSLKPYIDYAGPPPEEFSASPGVPMVQESEGADFSAPIYLNQSRNLWNVIIRRFQLQEESTNPAVAQQIEWFLAHPKILQRMLNNAVPYLYHVYQEVEKKNLPAELALLPLVESGYSPYAYSEAGATGLWQLMPATAASDGLRINWWYDARRDTLVSTQSALNFLHYLHGHFHEWPLAIAAYNAGQGTVQNAVDYNTRMNKPVDFWSLPLPAQTRDYFPKLIALSSIIMNAKHYNVELPFVADQAYFQTVTIHSQATLEQLAKMAGVSESVIQRLNPAFRRWATEPNNSYPILIPSSRVEYFKHELDKWTGKIELSWMYHQARGGETLAKIAKNYHTELNLLAKINGLSENTSIKTNESLLVPVRLHRRFNVSDQQAIYNNQVPQNAVQHNSFDVSSKISLSDSLEQILTKVHDE